jgi:hypothetical protein
MFLFSGLKVKTKRIRNACKSCQFPCIKVTFKKGPLLKLIKRSYKGSMID